jgi:hypothetical protein
MDHDAYQAFTADLAARAAALPEVLGLVALGSMSGEGAPADRFSDHDFFLVVASGTQERFRRDLSWLPDAGRVALAFQETPHGLKVVYDHGHLIEFAVFDPPELALARVNRYRVLLDRADVAERLRATRAATAAPPPSDRAWLAGQVLTLLLVGTGRFRRGERLSGQRLVKGLAVDHLLRLAALCEPAADPALPDDLDPARRFERAWPALAAEVAAALALDVPAAARRLLALARQLAGTGVQGPGFAAVDAALARS